MTLPQLPYLFLNFQLNFAHRHNEVAQMFLCKKQKRPTHIHLILYLPALCQYCKVAKDGSKNTIYVKSNMKMTPTDCEPIVNQRVSNILLLCSPHAERQAHPALTRRCGHASSTARKKTRLCRFLLLTLNNEPLKDRLVRSKWPLRRHLILIQDFACWTKCINWWTNVLCGQQNKKKRHKGKQSMN